MFLTSHTTLMLSLRIVIVNILKLHVDLGVLCAKNFDGDFRRADFQESLQDVTCDVVIIVQSSDEFSWAPTVSHVCESAICSLGG